MMRSGYSYAFRQSPMLNHTMMQAVKIMRMNQVDLHEFLVKTVERNPFLEIEGGGPVLRHQPENEDLPEIASEARTSLYRHLADQFERVIRTDDDMRIALTLLQEIDPSGWLTVPIERIALSNGFDPAMCLNILGRLQTLEPAGVFARDLAECLRLQAIDQGVFDEVMEGLIANLDTLAAHGLERLARQLKLDVSMLALRLQQIRGMNPKPGSIFGFDDIQHTNSDVVLNVTDQGLTYDLRRSSYPTVRASSDVITCELQKGTRLGKLKELLAEAKAVQTAVEMRKSTTLAVVAAVFTRQQEFVRHGYTALRPMRLSDIADDIDVSEATVSRIVSGLTIQCPHGHIKLKSLFCGSVSYCSQPQTKHVVLKVIEKLIAAEDKSSPLSDRTITSLIKESGLGISRRTVSKYRQSLGLGSPAMRRRHAELSQILERGRCVNYTNRLYDQP